ncbi:ankyrin repeat domain-containing protein 9 [Limanda limanda]|uniref:ankyrin repeat domain-containing protein 9 n=1 Tax=Limanda limanda TaxID=27771 RepID=UPI0029C97CCA|nr:ankyrin repeat domain-containing protein 9 [Limanda limanda]
MPWLLSPQDLVSPSERQCERSAFSFYRAVRERQPVWRLEDTRSMHVFSWEDGRARAFLPSEALLYALVHDHRDYARHLLDRFTLSALRAPRCSFCCRRCSGTPHLSVAVRCDRASILSAMLETLKRCGTQAERRELLDGSSSCDHVTDAGKSAVTLAVELSRAECLLLLLVHGARPRGLDVALQVLVSCDATRGDAQRSDAQRCLDLLLLFRPDAAPPRCLQEEPQRWQSLLGNEVFGWLRGLAPPPLLLQALRCLARFGPDQISTLPPLLQPHSWR